MTAFQVAELVGRAYMRAATLEVAVNGFRKSGIFPFDRNHFRDHDFAVQNGDSDDTNMDVEIAPVLYPIASQKDSMTTSAISVVDTGLMELPSPAPVPTPIASSAESAIRLETNCAVSAYSPLALALTMPSSKSRAETPPLLVSTPSGAALSNHSITRFECNPKYNLIRFRC